MDNSRNRLLDVFFYGLYMNEEILMSKNVKPRNKRIGKMATLLRDETAKTYGMVYSLTHDEIETLYKASGLIDYAAEALLIDTDDNCTIAALCCNLIVPPEDSDENREYYKKLIECMEKYNLPKPVNVLI